MAKQRPNKVDNNGSKREQLNESKVPEFKHTPPPPPKPEKKSDSGDKKK
jgi:hypothetical protein